MNSLVNFKEILHPLYFRNAPSVVTRSALDIGSGKIKIQVSEVNIKLNKITKILLHDYIAVPFKEDLCKSLESRLSEEIQCQAIDAIKELLLKASKYHPNASAAIATEFVRQAQNGNEFLQRLRDVTHLPIYAITPIEEGILAFLSAGATKTRDFENTVVWDSGNGSFQITGKVGNEHIVFCSRLGKISLLNLFLESQGKVLNAAKTPNPISEKDVTAVLQVIDKELEKFPYQLRAKLAHPGVTILKMGTHPLGGAPLDYTLEDISKTLKQRIGLKDEEIEEREINPLKHKILHSEPRFVVPNLVLAYGLMHNLGIKLACYAGGVGGNTSGILLSPKYWQE